MTRVFISGPFTPAISSDGLVDDIVHARIAKMISIVSGEKLEYFSAHLVESWGANVEDPGLLINRDLNELKSCTHVIAYLGSVYSFGTMLELGYAIAKRKPILVCRAVDFAINSDFYLGLLREKLVLEVIWRDDRNIESAIKHFLTDKF